MENIKRICKYFFYGGYLKFYPLIAKTLENLYYLFIKIKHFNSRYIILNNINNCKLKIDLKDSGISKELTIYNFREPFSTNFFKNAIKSNDIIIDIGGNIGYYALLESKKLLNGIIYAIEPVLHNYDLLTSNIKLNNAKNIFAYQYAIGEMNGTNKMYIYDKCNWSSLTKNPLGKIISEFEIETLSLDSFVNQYMKHIPTFIRMDVEGYEYYILKGAKDIFSKQQNLRMCIEFHPALLTFNQINEAIDILKKSEFQVEAIFVEPNPYAYRHLKIQNMARNFFNYPSFGYQGNDYECMQKLIKKNICFIIFLKRE